jgi:hypothetical protein
MTLRQTIGLSAGLGFAVPMAWLVAYWLFGTMVNIWTLYVWPTCILLLAAGDNRSPLTWAVAAVSVLCNVLLYVGTGVLLRGLVLLVKRVFS